MKTSKTFVRTIAVLALLGLGATAGIAQSGETARAVFAGGCFWCMEKPFDVLEGVVSTTSGFAGGHVENPSYDQVTAGGTGHREVVEVIYDPTAVSYEELLYVYWRNVDPFDAGGQFCDRGHSYSPAIYYTSDAQADLARLSSEVMRDELGRSPGVEIEPLDAFYSAEAYHQDYYQRNPIRYTYYRTRCGRDRRLESVWGSEARGENPRPWLETM